AFAAYRMKSPAAAADALKLARQYAKDPQEISRVEELERAVTYRSERPPGAASPSAELRESAGQPALRRREREPMAVREVARPAAPEHRETVKARFVRLDCLTPAVRLKLVDSEGQNLYLMIDNPTSVTIRGKDGGSIELACGPQQPPRSVTVEYLPAPDTRMLSAGLLRSIQFE
ncbi:MAG: hypothetical protein NTY38_32450, partial [Acidobacteria bacterium]|nr:hypothetical protein [Acidobacteriota bacterium]